MNGDPIHAALLTLWDRAKDQPGYSREEWHDLQNHILALEARVRILRTCLVDSLLALEPPPTRNGD